MTIIALDDEPLALVLVEKFAREIPGVKLLGTFTDAFSAADFLKKNRVDLLLTDINMPDVNGLQFVRDLPGERPMVIFVTAFKEHAHEGFDLDVVDYLVKPVSPERFKKAIQKAEGMLEVRQKAEADKPEFFFVFIDYQRVKVAVADILYIESFGDYVKIHLVGAARPLMSLGRLKHFSERLGGQGFRRIHRSFLVNLEKVEAIQKSRVRVGGVFLPVGAAFGQQLDA